jgi:hypothetical protein
MAMDVHATSSYTAEAEELSIPSLLFHTILTVTDDQKDAVHPLKTIHPLGTHATFKAAKDLAFKALEKLGYVRDQFDVYQEYYPQNEDVWPYDDGTLVHARLSGVNEFHIGITTTHNPQLLPVRQNNLDMLWLPSDGNGPYYVIQTKKDRHAGFYSTGQIIDIKGLFANQADAVALYMSCVLYEEIDSFKYQDSDKRRRNKSFTKNSQHDSGISPPPPPPSSPSQPWWPAGNHPTRDILSYTVQRLGETSTITMVTVMHTYLIYGNEKALSRHDTRV